MPAKNKSRIGANPSITKIDEGVLAVDGGKTFIHTLHRAQSKIY